MEELWREQITPEEDAEYFRTKAEILYGKSENQPDRKPRNLSVTEIIQRYFRLLSVTGFSFGSSASRTLPQKTIYLNVGQLQIFSPWFWWLKRRPDVMSAFMIHDVTPIEHPVYHEPIVVRLHHRIVRNTAGFARALIFPSEAARESVSAELRKLHAVEVPSHVELLPVPDSFLGPMEPDRELGAANYFLICGAIDPHKNHLFLLNVWKIVIEQMGARSPKLVIVGSPQVASRAVFKMLGENPDLSERVVVATGLSTPALRRLMIGARALIMPSISEGFGLPIVEALAQGTPVIASDIPAHREAGSGGDVVYLSIANPESWVECIKVRALAPHDRAASSYVPKTWAAYFQGVEKFLVGLETGQGMPKPMKCLRENLSAANSSRLW